MGLRTWPLVSIFLLLLSCCVLPAQAQADSPLAAVPRCGVICLAASLNVSSCTQFNYNQTCLCADQAYTAAVESCVLSTCKVKESLVTKNATQASCGIEPRDRSYALYLVIVILSVVSNLVVAARLVFRVFIHKTGLYHDDWAILMTLLVGISGTVFLANGSIPNGVGRDLWTLTADQITDFGMCFYATEVQYFISMATLKLSLLLFYLRIFPSTTVRRLLWATVVFDVSYAVAFTMTTVLQCRPISHFWTQWDGEHQGRCANVNAVGWANAIISIALDLWMLAVPLSQLRALHLHWKKKVCVALMFFVGTFVTVVSIIRLQSLVTFANSSNLTYDNWDVNFWSTIEIGVGIICACMPTMRQILAWYFPTVFGSDTRPGRYYPERDQKGGSHDRGFHNKFQQPPDDLDLERTESRSGLTWDDTTYTPSPMTKVINHPFPPISPPNGTVKPFERTPSLEDMMGIRVGRSFDADHSSRGEGPTSVQLVDMKKYPYAIHPGGRF